MMRLYQQVWWRCVRRLDGGRVDGLIRVAAFDGCPMSLNIKNEETCRLASELARLTGETMTDAITVALRERLEREKRARSVEARIRRLRAIRKRSRSLLKDRPSAVEHGNFLYDANGLPN